MVRYPDRKLKSFFYKTRCFDKKVSIIYFFLSFSFAIIILPSFICAADEGPLSTKGSLRCGLNVGYGYSFESNRDIRFISLYPYLGRLLTDPVGKGWYRGTVEGVLEGAFSLVRKHQRTYAAGANALLRYNFLPASESWRPYVQGGFGITYTNLMMHDFGKNLNFASNAACGIQYFYNPKNAVSFEWRFFHLSNAGIDDDNTGLNMSNFFIGFSRLF